MNTTVIYYKHADEVVTDWAMYIANLSIVCLIREVFFRPRPVEDFFSLFKICSGEADKGFFCNTLSDLAVLAIRLLRAFDFYASMVIHWSIIYTLIAWDMFINLVSLIVGEFMTIITFVILLTIKFFSIIINGVD